MFQMCETSAVCNSISDTPLFFFQPDDVRGLKGGPVDALIIHATAVRENVGESFLFQGSKSQQKYSGPA